MQRKKDLNYYLSLNYPITVEKYTEYDGKEYFAAEIPDLPGCGAEGKTIQEALENLEEAKKAWLEVSIKRGLEIPEPVTEEQFSGKFLLRIPPKLHRNLALKAKRANKSLNQYVRDALQTYLQTDLMASKVDSLLQEIKRLNMEFSEEIRGLRKKMEVLENYIMNIRFEGKTEEPIQNDIFVSPMRVVHEEQGIQA